MTMLYLGLSHSMVFLDFTLLICPENQKYMLPMLNYYMGWGVLPLCGLGCVFRCLGLWVGLDRKPGKMLRTLFVSSSRLGGYFPRHSAPLTSTNPNPVPKRRPRHCAQTGSGRAPEASRRSRCATHVGHLLLVVARELDTGATRASWRVDLQWSRTGQENRDERGERMRPWEESGQASVTATVALVPRSW
jgi:hypothetical protein